MESSSSPALSGKTLVTSAAGRGRHRRGAVERRRLHPQPIRVRLDSIRRFERRQARPANAEFDLSRRDGLRHHLGQRRGLGILADRQWRILHRPIDLAMGDTRANQNNETDNGDERAKTDAACQNRSDSALTP